MTQLKSLVPSALHGRRTRSEDAAPVPSTAKRRSFRILSLLTALWVLLVTSFGLLEVMFMWLPGELLLSLIGDQDASVLGHRAHYMSSGIVSWSLALAVFAQLWRPEHREAQMLLAVAIVITGSVVYAFSGTVQAWLIEELTLLAPVALLALLHPRARRLVSVPRFHRDMLGLAGVAAAPWLIFAFTQAQEQWRNLSGDPHVEPEHWATVALMGVVIVVAALLGSTDRHGWRLAAWIAAVASVNYGLHSLVFPEPPSAASAPWAIAAIAWGTAYGISILRRRRTPDGLVVG